MTYVIIAMNYIIFLQSYDRIHDFGANFEILAKMS
jgi:hypothetical protein